jgi:hypothetical protein
MTDRELMQQALAVLQKHVDYYDYEHFTSVCELEPAKDLILALRERLTQPQRTHWEGCEEVHPECKKPGCAECGKAGGWALYCVACVEKWKE